jgi:transcription initiation factor TFIID TATA-box-binding protein
MLGYINYIYKHLLFVKILKEKKMEYKIVNLVASSSLGAGLDLYNLATAIPEVEYEPEQFPGAILKMDEPRVSLLLFKNGNIIISGASCEKDIKTAIKKATKIIGEVQKGVTLKERVSYKIVNLVATSNLNKQIDLFNAAVTLDNIEYEPEQFPGAIVRLFNPKLTMLLFKNGKLICAGAKSEEDIVKGLNKLKKVLAGQKDVNTEEKTSKKKK